MDRNFPVSIIDKAFSHVMGQRTLHSNAIKRKKQVLLFTVTYQPPLPIIGNIILKYWDLLNISKQEGAKCMHYNYKPFIAFKRPRNLQDLLVKSRFNPCSDETAYSVRCSSKRRSHCNRILHFTVRRVARVTHRRSGVTFLIKNMNIYCPENDIFKQ